MSTPVHSGIKRDVLLNDMEVVKISQIVARRLDDYLDKLKAIIKSNLSKTKEEEHQSKLHGLAWVATYVESLKQLSIWADRLLKNGSFGKAERMILILSFNEYLNQIFGGIIMSQGEIIRPVDLEYKKSALEKLNCKEVLFFKDEVDADHLRSELINLIIQNEGTSFIGNDGLNEDQRMIRQEFYKFSKDKIEPFAHDWHMKDELIPLKVIEELAQLGVFGLTTPEEFGGTGLDKITMCVVCLKNYPEDTLVLEALQQGPT